MNIVQGSGSQRSVIELPHGSVFAQAAKDEPAEYARALGAVAELTLEPRVNAKARHRQTDLGLLVVSPHRMRKMQERTKRMGSGWEE